MSCLIVSKREVSAILNLCETPGRKVDLVDSMPLEAQGRCPPEKKECRQTNLSESKEELPESWRGSEISTLSTGSVIEEQMEERYRRQDCTNCAKPSDL